MGNLHARDEVIKAPVMPEYNWEMTDAGQKTLAIKMTYTGIVLAAIIAVLAAAIPENADSPTQFSGGEQKNTILSGT